MRLGRVKHSRLLELIQRDYIGESAIVRIEGDRVRFLAGEVHESPVASLSVEWREKFAISREKHDAHAQFAAWVPGRSDRMLVSIGPTRFDGVRVASWIPESSVTKVIQRTVWLSLFLALGVGLLSAAIVAWIVRWALSPVRALTDAAARIADGDSNVGEIPLTSENHEIGQLVTVFRRMVGSLQQNEKLRRLFGKFNNRALIEKLSRGDAALGGKRVQATVMFCDLRGFTTRSEGLEPEAVVQELNEYFTRIVPLVTRNGGVVDKFVGDAVLAIWGVPFAHANDAANAVRAASEMRLELARLNELRRSRGQDALKFGIGVHSGEVVAGTVGSEDRQEYTVIGDVVNTASRLESATKDQGVDVLVSEAVVQLSSDWFLYGELRSIELKGKSEPVRAHELLGLSRESWSVGEDKPAA